MKQKLVAYSSASGVTENAARLLAEAADADLFEIRPEKPYTDADLNWMNKKSRSSVEMNHPEERPEMAETCKNLSQYDTIFLGFPIWWYTAPRIIQTFLESGDFSGKRIILFATSGGSGFGKTASDLKPSVSDSATIENGQMLNGSLSVDALKRWADFL